MTELGIEGLEEAVEIGRGGFGVVYRARQSRFDRSVAVKVVTGATSDSVLRTRFEREILAMGRLSSHPNILPVYDAGELPSGEPYILMQYCGHGSLAQQVEESGPQRPQDVVERAVQLAGALHSAHEGGVLHRDVKPENILRSEFGTVQLTDFGIARLRDSGPTRTEGLTASLAHVAPELIDGQPASVASDLYALGSTMFVLLTGQPAFIRATDESMTPVIARVLTQPPPDLRHRGIPPPLVEIIERLLAKDPGDRYASGVALGDDLRRVQRQAGLTMTHLPVVRPESPERTTDRGAAPLPPVRRLPSDTGARTGVQPPRGGPSGPTPQTGPTGPTGPKGSTGPTGTPAGPRPSGRPPGTRGTPPGPPSRGPAGAAPTSRLPGPTAGGPSGPVPSGPRGTSGSVRGGPSGPVRGGPSGPVRGGPSGPVTGGPSGPVRGGPSGPVPGGPPAGARGPSAPTPSIRAPKRRRTWLIVLGSVVVTLVVVIFLLGVLGALVGEDSGTGGGVAPAPPAPRTLVAGAAPLEVRSAPMVSALLESPFHEERFVAIVILVRRYEQGGPVERAQVHTLHLPRTDRVTGWDLVDASAPSILGGRACCSATTTI